LRLNLTGYQLGVAWYIPTFIVPAMLVTHIMIYAMLLKRSRHYRAQVAGSLSGSRL
jgi:hypothetical protein